MLGVRFPYVRPDTLKSTMATRCFFFFCQQDVDTVVKNGYNVVQSLETPLRMIPLYPIPRTCMLLQKTPLRQNRVPHRTSVCWLLQKTPLREIPAPHYSTVVTQ